MGAKKSLTRYGRGALVALGLGVALSAAATPHSLGICEEDDGMFLDGMRLPGLTGRSVRDDQQPLVRHLVEQGILRGGEPFSERVMQAHLQVVSVSRQQVVVQQWAGDDDAALAIASHWRLLPYEAPELMHLEIELQGMVRTYSDIWFGNMPLSHTRYTERAHGRMLPQLQAQLDLGRPLMVRNLAHGHERILYPQDLPEIIARSVAACATPPIF
ncbi:hypothetical protein [Isoalcanivorax indicus]|uniref:hypothetical protein n=1 Tax=Isoalcanivorax indicus TaxID=2202653 RepID=UPI000DB9A0F3|nr:hypothetical protein [Isoalcanivorax indicus]